MASSNLAGPGSNPGGPAPATTTDERRTDGQRDDDAGRGSDGSRRHPAAPGRAPHPPTRVREGAGGEAPPEQPDVLLAEFEQAAERLRTLISRINRTNLTAKTADGETLTDALARRDVLALRYTVHRELAVAAAEQPERYSLREIKLKATVDVAVLRRTVDELARERRELDVALQAANWANALAE